MSKVGQDLFWKSVNPFEQRGSSSGFSTLYCILKSSMMSQVRISDNPVALFTTLMLIFAASEEVVFNVVPSSVMEASSGYFDSSVQVNSLEVESFTSTPSLLQNLSILIPVDNEYCLFKKRTCSPSSFDSLILSVSEKVLISSGSGGFSTATSISFFTA